MYGTVSAIAAIARANPGTVVSEDRVRHVLRKGHIPAVRRFAGRLVWSTSDIELLAQHLGLKSPDFASAKSEGAGA